VHQTYRIQYLKDVVLPRVLDDGTYATLSSMALFNSVEVIVALASDPTFLPQLFLKLKKHSPSESPSWRRRPACPVHICS
jgi:protein phosphatase-4 regulatory subunit 3